MRVDVANLPVLLRKPGQLSNPRIIVWPLELGLGTLNPRFVAWPLKLGLGTHNPRLLHGPSSWGSGLAIHALLCGGALSAVRVQCARSATIWVSGRSRNPYFVVL